MSGPQPVPLREPPDLRPWVKRALLRWNSHYREYERVVASDMLSPALIRFLRFIVVETLDGRGEQLTESAIAEKVFKQREFAPSEKSVVRVEKRRLREKLKDYYDGPGKDDPIVISLGSTFVPIFSPRENGLPRQASRIWSPGWRWSIPAAGLIVAVAILWVFLKKPSEQFLLTRLTNDSGFTTDPAISPDGKLVAYASDRSGEGNLDIWVQNIGTGDRVRLAPNPADDYQPSFSPDGSKVVFRSDRDGGGIYTAAVLGGDLKLIAPKGRGPRFSPDGQRIVYWVGESYFVRTQVYVVPARGGTPKAVLPEFYGAHDAVWSADGKRVLLWGQRSESSAPDWWVAPVDGGAPLQTGAFAVFAHENLSAAGPAAWVGNEVFFAARGDTSNLWTAEISARTCKISGTPHRVTFGTDQEGEPSVATNGSLVFTSFAASTNVWRLPVDLNAGKVTGDLLRVTRDLSTEVFPSISKNRRLVFSSDRSGKREIWVKNLALGTDTMLASSSSEFDSPKISPDGTKVAYTAASPAWVIHVAPTVGGDDRVFKNGGPPRDFSSDGTKLLFEAKTCSPYCVGLLDLTQGTRELIKHPTLALYPESFSPDDEWIAFQARRPDNDSNRTIYVTPFHGGTVGGPETWIAVTDGNEMDREVKWSPDGNLLYFLSERDGFRCIWGQRLDPKTKHAAGAPFPVYHFHHTQQSLTSIGSPGKVGLSITDSGLLFSLAETTGNIWLARRRK
jgi:eukaryotic-like serine/threonine-protein kinase